MQSLVKREKHAVWEGEVTVWQEVSFELSQKSRIPEAPLAFLSLFSCLDNVYSPAWLPGSFSWRCLNISCIVSPLLVPRFLGPANTSVCCFPASLSSPSLDVVTSLIILTAIPIVGALCCFVALLKPRLGTSGSWHTAAG